MSPYIHQTHKSNELKEVNITVCKLYFNIFNCNESKVTINVGKCLCFKGDDRTTYGMFSSTEKYSGIDEGMKILVHS